MQGQFSLGGTCSPISLNGRDRCSDEMSLKMILRALRNWCHWFTSFLRLIPTSAAYYDFHRSKNDCSPIDVSHCQRCQILIARWSSSDRYSCANCARYSSKSNLAMRIAKVVLNSLTQLAHHAQLDCQLKGCNSLEKVNLIYRTSKMTFNFDEVFQNSSSDMI